MKGAFLKLCTDGSFHPRMQHKDKHIVTYSMTLSSPYFVKECGLYPTSRTHIILPHVQLHGKKNVHTLKSVLQFRHIGVPICLNSLTHLSDCHVHDLVDGKALYLLLGHAHWQCNEHPYILCKCSRGYTECMSDEEYLELVKTSQKHWENCKQLTKDQEEFGDGTPYTLLIN